MRNYLSITPLIIFLCVVIVFFYFLISKNDPSSLPSVLINQKAPVFETTSLFNENNLFIFEEEFGQETVIVNFFAAWCVPCRIEHPYINLLSKEKGIKVIGINYKDDTKKAIEWLKKLGNPYSNVAVDLNGNIGINWGVYGIPETFIVSKKNIILYRQVGPITKETYDKFYKQIKESNK